MSASRLSLNILTPARLSELNVENKILQIQTEALTELAAAKSIEEIKALSVKYVGRKGFVTSALKNVSTLPPEERPLAGKQTNQVKQALDAAFAEAVEKIQQSELLSDAGIDVSLPGRIRAAGNLHPLTQVTQEISDIFERLGFSVVEGPETETDFYNFEALNVAKDHPARDMQDTFYLSDNIVLRTQTSPMQIRTMENQEPPVRIIAPGKVFRNDSDVTHTPMFHQIEGLLVDKDVSFGDLKGILTTFVHMFFGVDTNLRFRTQLLPLH